MTPRNRRQRLAFADGNASSTGRAPGPLIAGAGLALALTLPEARRTREERAALRRGGFWRALTQRSLVPIWFISLSQSIVFTGYFTFMRTFVDETGVGSVGIFYAAFASIAVVLRGFFGWISAFW